MHDLIASIFATRRRICATIFLIILGLLACSLYLQHVVGLEPCPMCILQRYAFVLIALGALVAALARGVVGRIGHAVAALFALAGGGVAAWQVWLQYRPPENVPCGPGLEYMLSELPLAKALPRIFQGSGDCSRIDWSFLGLSMAAWALVWFTIFFVTLLIALRRRA